MYITMKKNNNKNVNIEKILIDFKLISKVLKIFYMVCNNELM